MYVNFSMRIKTVRAATLAALLLMSESLYGGVFSIRPIEFVTDPDHHVVATGTITTAGNTSVITDWDLTVTTTDRLAHFTPSNTSKNLSLVSVSSDGQQLMVLTSPDPLNEDGGFLGFRSPNPFQDVGTVLADFTGSNSAGGQAMYMYGAAFDYLDLNQPAATEYVAARANAAGGGLFNLVPLHFSNDTTLHGTLKTDRSTGTLAASNLKSWDLYVDQVTTDRFTPANSVLRGSGVGLSADGKEVTVDNPGGSLMFLRGLPGKDLYGLVLADLSDTSLPGGMAGYFQGALSSDTLDLHAGPGPWSVTGTDPIFAIPEPGAGLLFAMALTAMVAAGRLSRARNRQQGRIDLG